MPGPLKCPHCVFGKQLPTNPKVGPDASDSWHQVVARRGRGVVRLGPHVGLAPGDVVVLMSDGYPERFNGKNEMLGYGSAKSVLLEIAILPPQEIIEVFVKIADKWAEGRPQDDDMTFVVMKLKCTPSAKVFDNG